MFQINAMPHMETCPTSEAEILVKPKDESSSNG